MSKEAEPPTLTPIRSFRLAYEPDINGRYYRLSARFQDERVDDYIRLYPHELENVASVVATYEDIRWGYADITPSGTLFVVRR